MELLYINTGRLPHDAILGTMLGLYCNGAHWVPPPWADDDKYIDWTVNLRDALVADDVRKQTAPSQVRWGSQVMDEQVLRAVYDILSRDEVKLEAVRVYSRDTEIRIALSYFGGGPDIAGQYDDVWRWSLLYGMALHCCNNCSEELMQQISSR
jgi:hypothetical protein